MSPDYKKRRDKAFKELAWCCGCSYDFDRVVDWARADLMREVEEILVNALEKYRSVGANEIQDVGKEPITADEALAAWERIKGDGK